MPANLLIVESPSKAKTLKKYLGSDFEILASYGHIRDLVPKNGAVDPDKNFAMKYQIIAKNSKHVDAIAAKYILPDEGTYDFALMYIPAENVYYESIIKDDADGALLEYALKRRVVPVSPGSFYAYLQAIVLGLRGFQIEENARRIMEDLARLRGDFARFAEDFDTLGKHLANAKTKHDDAGRRLERFQDKLENVHEPAADPLLPPKTAV